MRNNYLDLLNNSVEIPIIQRDYAQGRTDTKTSKIRKDFLNVLFEFIKKRSQTDPNAEIELDFIYGFNQEDSQKQTTFIPIDGQQRITTLWLIYWFVSVKENIRTEEKSFLSNFVYETRHSTTEFFRRLVAFNPNFSSDSIKEEIKDQSWYFEVWDYDPSIQAMLVVLKDIENLYFELDLKNVWEIIHTTCPFYFYKLDMDKVGLTDDLYIKMNSRGKALTEFEYFKASFAEVIKNLNYKERFERSIDGIWMETMWNIVFNSNQNQNGDVAQTVDKAFLNLFNFLTSLIAFKNNIKTDDDNRYLNTVESAVLLKVIYASEENQLLLFETLDAICSSENKRPEFWDDTFYYQKESFSNKKTRLFFTSNETNLLKRCLFHFDENRGLSFPEQLMLYACVTQFRKPQDNFEDIIRIVRNLVANSENELRDSILGQAFKEIEHFVSGGELDKVTVFKTDQIEEEKEKVKFCYGNSEFVSILNKLEDSDIFQGSISILPLDKQFGERAIKFLELFDEDDFIIDFYNKTNLLLCFGDYSQENGTLTNLLSPSIKNIRKFFTTPGYNKSHFLSRTRKVLLNCLDFYIEKPEDAKSIIDATLSIYESSSLDWTYYFLKYPSLRDSSKEGYFQWHNGDYCIWKLHKTNFRGYHWDPFLDVVAVNDKSGKCSFGYYASPLLLMLNRKKIEISSLPNGFLFSDGMLSGTENTLLKRIRNEGIINADDILLVLQDEEGVDIEDRIEKLQITLQKIIALT